MDVHLLRHSTVRFHFYSWKSVDKRLSARGLPLPGVPSGSAQSPDSRGSTCLAMPRSDKVIADRSDVPDEIRPSRLLGQFVGRKSFCCRTEREIRRPRCGARMSGGSFNRLT